ncbi:MAG: helicase-related protein, partial [Hyphomicrobiaceae bacterium]|nr:helicase-related protein [Hyphomicrobiaceae bacterium]
GNRIGFDQVALVTGEEKIKPERARYWISTVEAMPRDIDVDFLAIDEIQLCADPERGHVFTDRLLHARGRQETLLLGAQTMREAIQELIPGANFISRPRLSKLTYAGQKKITRLPARTAVVAFSAAEVYSIAELIRRQRGGAAVVLGALSPRTRNAQVALYQSGDVDFLVATDAIGMGLNLDVDHVAFSATRKFDGQVHRNLTVSELAQIAGRAGRHMNDGTFGVTGEADPFEKDTVDRLEQHIFESVRVLQWRNRTLDFASLDRLRDSLRNLPDRARLVRARTTDDVEALETVAADREIADLATSPAAVARLWEVCQVPDYRKISSSSHAEMIGSLYRFLMTGEQKIPEDWFARQVQFADRVDGDIDTLANRISHIRTWTFVANRADWLKDPAHWQGRTREIEDQLSDALHACLTQRFIDQRTSALMKGMRDKDELAADIAEDGRITVESHYVGRLAGFRFFPETHADGIHGKAARAAAAHVVSRELGMRARRVAAAKADAIKLRRDGTLLWRDEEIGRIEAGEDPLRPTVTLSVDEHLAGPDKDKIQARLDQWLRDLVRDKLKPLVELTEAEDVTGLARGIAFRMKEGFGILPRHAVADEMKALDQPSRAQLRKYGVRFGAFNIYLPLLLKPAAAELAATLWALREATANGLARDSLPEPPRPGLTSVAADASVPEAYYRAYGYHLCGPRAVRVDILERLADLIRPLIAWRAKEHAGQTPPKGSTGDGGFTVTPEMMSILGCSPDELGNVLKMLGFRLERRPVKAIPAVPVEAATAHADADTPGPAEHGASATPADAAPEVTSAPGETAAGAELEPLPSADASPPEAVGGVSIEALPPTAAVELAAVEPATPGDVEPAASVDASEPVAQAAEGESAAAADARATPDAQADPGVEPEAEPAFEDVWRPRRHRGEGEPRQGRSNRRGDRNRAPSRRPAPAGSEGTLAGDDTAHAATAANADGAGQPPGGGRQREQRRGERGGRGRDRDRQRGDRPAGAMPDGAPASASVGDSADPAKQGQRQRDQRGGLGGGSHAPGASGGERPGDGRHRDGRGRDRDGRDGRGREGRGRDDRRREERRPLEVQSAGPRRKSGAADPDSPFAALGALKEALQKRSEEKSSS